MARLALVLDDAGVLTGRRAACRSRGSRPACPALPPSPSRRGSRSSARTLPQASPATIASPTRSVPRATSIVATGPRPTSSRLSMIGPEASAFGVARQLELGVGDEEDLLERGRRDPRRSWPRRRRTASSRPTPPAGGRGATSSWRTLVGLASGWSILFTATTIGTSAARAWLIDSTVCGMTPSSAATTSTAMSVTFAPRARSAVNASWPGVSRNVIRRPLWSTWYAPMCCVIPPASVSTTARLADRVEQRRLPVVDVAHDRDDRRSRRQIVGVVLVDLRLELLLVGVLDLDLALELARDELDRLVGERLRDGDHLADVHHDLDDLGHRARRAPPKAP